MQFTKRKIHLVFVTLDGHTPCIKALQIFKNLSSNETAVPEENEMKHIKINNILSTWMKDILWKFLKTILESGIDTISN